MAISCFKGKFEAIYSGFPHTLQIILFPSPFFWVKLFSCFSPSVYFFLLLSFFKVRSFFLSWPAKLRRPCLLLLEVLREATPDDLYYQRSIPESHARSPDKHSTTTCKGANAHDTQRSTSQCAHYARMRAMRKRARHNARESNTT